MAEKLACSCKCIVSSPDPTHKMGTGLVTVSWLCYQQSYDRQPITARSCKLWAWSKIDNVLEELRQDHVMLTCASSLESMACHVTMSDLLCSGPSSSEVMRGEEGVATVERGRGSGILLLQSLTGFDDIY